MIPVGARSWALCRGAMTHPGITMMIGSLGYPVGTLVARGIMHRLVRELADVFERAEYQSGPEEDDDAGEDERVTGWVLAPPFTPAHPRRP